MHGENDALDRRDFLKSVGATGAGLAAAQSAFAAKSSGKTSVGVIGVGSRCTSVARSFASIGQKDNSCQIVAVSDVYEKRKRVAAEHHKVTGYLDYRELLAKPDIDA